MAGLLSHLSALFYPVPDECRESDQYFVCYVSLHTYDPQLFHLCKDLTLREEY
jgi:hypothetical protein